MLSELLKKSASVFCRQASRCHSYDAWREASFFEGERGALIYTRREDDPFLRTLKRLRWRGLRLAARLMLQSETVKPGCSL